MIISESTGLSTLIFLTFCPFASNKDRLNSALRFLLSCLLHSAATEIELNRLFKVPCKPRPEPHQQKPLETQENSDKASLMWP